MRKFIIFSAKCILAASPIIAIILYTALCPFSYMDNEFPAWKYKKELQSGQVRYENTDTLILGDSGAMSALIPEKVCDDAVNLAAGGATSIEMYYFLKNYLNNNEAPENIVIMFSPFHYSAIDNFDTRTVYFRALSVKDAIELYREAGKLCAESVYRKGAVGDELAARLYLPTKYLPALYNARFITRYDENRTLYERIADSRGHGYFGTAESCSDLNYEAKYTQMPESGDAALLAMYMDKLLDECERTGGRVILLQPAMNEESFDALDDNYVTEYTSYIEALGDRHPAVEVETHIRRYQDDCFGDAMHLNEKGAARFSEEISEYFK